MIEVKKLPNELGFRVSQEMLSQIYEWEHSVDELVFKEQLATGSFRGKFPISPELRIIMERAEQAGKLMPYYGAGGSSGACRYKFQIDNSECKLQVEHSVAQETLDLVGTVKKQNTLLGWIRKPEIQFSFLPYVTNEKLSHPWTGKRNLQLVCKIAEQEYQNLKSWSNWVDEQALTARYIYQFGQVSLGSTGFSVTVLDKNTKTMIDVTDYDDW